MGASSLRARPFASNVWRISTAAWLALVLAACSSGGGADGPPQTAPEPVVVDPQRMAWVAGLRCSGARQTGWCWQRPQPDGLGARSAQFVDASHGWVVGDQGSIRHTRDGGLTWADQTIATEATLRFVHFADTRRGWAFTEQGQVWGTQDGGAAWVRLGEMGFAVQGVLGHPSGAPVALGGAVGAAVSRDGGATWAALPILQASAVSVDADGSLWIVESPALGGRSRLSRDMGLTWQDSPASAASPSWLATVPRFAAMGFAWVVANDPAQAGKAGHLLRRAAIDAPWVRTTLARAQGPTGEVPWPLAVDADGGIVARSGDPDDPNVLWRSADSGQTWTRIALPAVAWPAPGLDVQAVDSRTLLLRLYEDVTRRSHFLSTDGGRSWREVFQEVSEQNHFTVRLHREAQGGMLAQVQAARHHWMRSTDDGLTWTELPGSSHAGEGPWVGLTMAADGKGLTVSTQGLLVDTVDGGQHWVARRDDAIGFVHDMAAQPDGGLWMVAVGPDGVGRLLRSADRGRNWAVAGTSLPPEPPSGSGPSLRRILYANGPVLHVLAEVPCPSPRNCPLKLYHSANAGQSWQAGPPLASALFEVRMAYVTASVALGYKGSVLQRSTDGGDTWTVVSAPGISGYGQKIHFADANNGWVVGPDSLLLRSRDGGLVWEAVPVPAASATDAGLRHSFTDIAFADALHGWIVGAAGLVLATRDGGQTWERQKMPTSQDLVLVRALDARTAWVAGAEGAILVTASGGSAAR